MRAADDYAFLHRRLVRRVEPLAGARPHCLASAAVDSSSRPADEILRTQTRLPAAAIGLREHVKEGVGSSRVRLAPAGR